MRLFSPLCRSLLAGAIALAAEGALPTSTIDAQGAASTDSLTIAGLRWRNIGPANMMGRVSDVEGIPSPSKTFYVAAAAGGIWKTTNNGTSFRPVFDRERVVSMGDLAIAPSDTNIVWAGTGEPNSRNSISPGGGIYKSTDGGMSWRMMGLEATQTIGRIVIHPTDPNIVYVAALGAIWNANRERGMYKTTDGGKNWELIKFISDKAGFVDVAMDPTNPDVLWASSYERVRGPWFLKSGGPGSALWKTTDAGKNWTEVEGGGFPETMKGRISVAIAASNPRIMYTMIEADTAPNRSTRQPRSDAAARQTRPSGLYRSNDGGTTWARMAPNNVRPFYYSQVRIDPKNPERVYFSSTPVNFSDDGGKTVKNATVGIHVDHHAQWIDPNDPERFIVGNDGGVAITYDKGGNYNFLNSIALGQFYNISFDMSVPYRVCGGLQDNGSWCGPSRRARGAITNAMWATVGGGDGFHTAQDPTDPNIVYSESQGGNIGRVNVATGERVALQKPNWRARYRQFEDSMIVARGDTTVPETAVIRRQLADLRARASADSASFDLRWNWNTPFLLSPHNPTVFYTAANRVMKSTRRGDEMYPISPDLSTRDTAAIRVATRTTGGITPDVTGAEMYSTIVSLTESPMRPGLLYAGTDDGNVWLTRNDGGAWDNLTGRFAGVPNKSYVSRIEASPHDTSAFFVTFDNHRNGDFTPYVFVSTDFGKSFRSIAANLPTGGPDFVHVIRQDPTNRDLLFVGTDVGAYVSSNFGQSWQRFMTGLPTVPVHDLKIHPRDRELIAGTHGRSIWVVDIAPLQQMNATVASSEAHLFAPRTAFQFGDVPIQGESMGHQVFRTPSPEYGAEITYRLSARTPGQVRVVISDVRGDTLRTLTGPAIPGVHRVVWDFRGKAPAAAPLSPAGLRDSMTTARRQDFVFDSLAKAGMDTTMLNRTRRQIADPQALAARFAGGGGGGVLPGVFTPRPGESSPPVRGAGGGGAAAGAGGENAPPDVNFLQQLNQLLNPRGGGFFGGGGGGARQAPLVGPGDYLVSLTVNGKTMRQVMRVERTNLLGLTTSFFEGEADREP